MIIRCQICLPVQVPRNARRPAGQLRRYRAANLGGAVRLLVVRVVDTLLTSACVLKTAMAMNTRGHFAPFAMYPQSFGVQMVAR